MSAANEWHVELNMRREIPYLQVTIYYFVYRINTIAYYWEGKPTSLMNENKWIDNPGIAIVECVGGNSKDGKMRWIMMTKPTMVVIFNLKNSYLLTLSLPTEEVFQVNGQNQLVTNLLVVDFHSQPREMLIPKPALCIVRIFPRYFRQLSTICANATWNVSPRPRGQKVTWAEAVTSSYCTLT